MAADDESNYSSNEDDDPSFLAMQAQQRLFQLKKERDERMNAVVKGSAAAMDKLRGRVVRYQKEQRTKETDVLVASISQIVEAVERRRDIEQQMKTLVTQVSSTTQEIEEMMKAGFQGREEDVKQAR
ncbi:hypothetical protein FSARC_13673 [Fusarium sarcochroum]|uniref:Uncharacterized protein n=1 Tax=Fusarium sarcochroum TaxID=1208366 RepID=A0A8H4WS28_9HYPO|nr:hypothetical protein FSARC_13673 [Fusarium sarcochroum]